MKSTLLILLLLIIGHNLLSAQDGQSPSLIKENNIQKIETYFLEPNATQDSTLITKEEYNDNGWRTKIEIYDSLGLANHYEYDYQFDSIKTERRTYFRNELSSVTKLKNDQYGNELTAIDYDADGNKLGMASEILYNDQQQLVETIVYNGDLIIFQEKRKYHQNGNLKEVDKIKPDYLKSTSVYKENGELKDNQDSKHYWNKEIFENYRSTGITLEQVDCRRAYKIGVIAVSGILDLAPFDNLRTQTFFLSSGLIDYEQEFVNGKLIGKRSYKYLK